MPKKLTTIFILLTVFLCNFAFCDEVISQQTEINKEQNIFLDAKIQKELKSSILNVYGKENADEIYQNILLKIDKAKNLRSEELKKQDINRGSDWFKEEIIYMFYVDKFGVVKNNKNNTFQDTKQMLAYLKELGVTTLYLLPFLDSPMEDSGFDVKNPQDVRNELGGFNQFESFIKLAKSEGFKIKADLILNHLSDKHEWFKKLQEGDLKYLDYFIWTDKIPEYRKYNDEKLGTVIEYIEDDGKISKRRLIFPDNAQNHWRKITINNKDYYLYHTFYPFQLDINWQNPEVLYYMLDTTTKWANLGVDIFRMDAIPYLSKEKGTNGENQPKTHNIINILSNYIQLSAPSSVIQVEACQHPKDIIPYFGKTRDVQIETDNTKKNLSRTSEAQIAYNFPYMNGIWASLISENKKYFIDTYKETPDIPKNTTWGTFLRVHDELTLEMASPEVRNLIYGDLEPKGSGFRKGFGVSGRLANFLDNNPDRIELAYSILFSIPGIPIIYYGDEIGAQNNKDNAYKMAKKRANDNKLFKKFIFAFDSRDINRGAIPKKMFYGSQFGWYNFNSKVYDKVKNLITIRKKFPVFKDGSFEILKTNSDSNFSYIRKNKNQEILIINNLSKKKLIAEIPISTSTIFKHNRKITKIKNLINNDNIKVNVSLKNNTMHLRLAPYQTLWLDLSGDINE